MCVCEREREILGKTVSYYFTREFTAVFMGEIEFQFFLVVSIRFWYSSLEKGVANSSREYFVFPYTLDFYIYAYCKIIVTLGLSVLTGLVQFTCWFFSVD